MVPTVSLTKARISTSMSCWNASISGWEGSVIPLSDRTEKAKAVKGTVGIPRSCLWGLPGRSKAFVKVRGLGGSSWGNPCCCCMADGPCAEEEEGQATWTPALA